MIFDQANGFASLTVTTTNKEKFTGDESAVLAFLIYKRFGRDRELALQKWRQMLELYRVACHKMDKYAFARTVKLAQLYLDWYDFRHLIEEEIFRRMGTQKS